MYHLIINIHITRYLFNYQSISIETSQENNVQNFVHDDKLSLIPSNYLERSG